LKKVIFKEFVDSGGRNRVLTISKKSVKLIKKVTKKVTFMRASTKLRYSIRILTELASRGNDSFITLKELSSAQGLSPNYMKRIMPFLEGAGIVTSSQGVKGGYRLSRNPSQITLKDIIQAFKGSIKLAPCVDDISACSKYPFCSSRIVWEEATRVLLDFFEKITLNDLLMYEEKLKRGRR